MFCVKQKSIESDADTGIGLVSGEVKGLCHYGKGNTLIINYIYIPNTKDQVGAVGYCRLVGVSDGWGSQV